MRMVIPRIQPLGNPLNPLTIWLFDMESTLRAPSIDPDAYLSADTLQKELETIWPAAWHLVALTRDLPHDKDYLQKRVAKSDLVLHRLGERIIAYANVCPHRFSALVDQPSGNAPLQCPYHLWSFDPEGYPSAVPHRQGIPLAEFTRGARLSTWQVAMVGEFISSASNRYSLARSTWALWAQTSPGCREPLAKSCRRWC